MASASSSSGSAASSNLDDELIAGYRIPVMPDRPLDTNQRRYIEAVLRACSDPDEAKRRVLLEAPTGSGKTLCYLRALVAWYDHHRYAFAAGYDLFLPARLLILSHTHAQLSQIVAELRTVPNANTLSVAVLGSKPRSCARLKTDLVGLDKDSAQLSERCYQDRTSQRCSPYLNLVASRDDKPVRPKSPLDIEDLGLFALQQRNVCAHYLSHDIAQQADIIFMPYPYLLTPSLLLRLEKTGTDNVALQLEKRVVFIDEAHNIDGDARNALAIHFDESIIAATTYILQSNALGPDSAVRRHCEALRKAYQDYSTKLEAILRGPANNRSTRPTVDVNSLTQLLSGFIAADPDPRGSQNAFEALLQSLSWQLGSFKATQLGLIALSENLAKYRVLAPHLAVSKVVAGFDVTKPPLRGFALSLFPTNGAVAFLAAWSRSHALLMTTGTFGDIRSFNAQLGTTFAQSRMLRLPHPIEPADTRRTHIWVQAITHPVPSVAAAARQPPAFILTTTGLPHFDRHPGPYSVSNMVRSCILHHMEVLPPGAACLAFFTSKAFLEQRQSDWASEPEAVRTAASASASSSSSWKRFTPARDYWQQQFHSAGIAVEAEVTFQPSATDSTLQSWLKRHTSDRKRRVLLLGVLRGTLSEGLDLRDDLCRMVLVFGIPNLPPYEPVVAAIRARDPSWYDQQAVAAINQAVGRVLRHKLDFGIALLVDERYSQLPKGISRWIAEAARPHCRDSNAHIEELKQFYLVSQRLHSPPASAASASSSPPPLVDRGPSPARVPPAQPVASHMAASMDVDYTQPLSQPGAQFGAGRSDRVPRQVDAQSDLLSVYKGQLSAFGLDYALECDLRESGVSLVYARHASLNTDLTKLCLSPSRLYKLSRSPSGFPPLVAKHFAGSWKRFTIHMQAFLREFDLIYRSKSEETMRQVAAGAPAESISDGLLKFFVFPDLAGLFLGSRSNAAHATSGAGASAPRRIGLTSHFAEAVIRSMSLLLWKLGQQQTADNRLYLLASLDAFKSFGPDKFNDMLCALLLPDLISYTAEVAAQLNWDAYTWQPNAMLSLRPSSNASLDDFVREGLGQADSEKLTKFDLLSLWHEFAWNAASFPVNFSLLRNGAQARVLLVPDWCIDVLATTKTSVAGQEEASALHAGMQAASQSITTSTPVLAGAAAASGHVFDAEEQRLVAAMEQFTLCLDVALYFRKPEAVTEARHHLLARRPSILAVKLSDPDTTNEYFTYRTPRNEYVLVASYSLLKDSRSERCTQSGALSATRSLFVVGIAPQPPVKPSGRIFLNPTMLVASQLKLNASSELHQYVPTVLVPTLGIETMLETLGTHQQFAAQNASSPLSEAETKRIHASLSAPYAQASGVLTSAKAPTTNSELARWKRDYCKASSLVYHLDELCDLGELVSSLLLPTACMELQTKAKLPRLLGMYGCIAVAAPEENSPTAIHERLIFPLAGLAAVDCLPSLQCAASHINMHVLAVLPPPPGLPASIVHAHVTQSHAREAATLINIFPGITSMQHVMPQSAAAGSSASAQATTQRPTPTPLVSSLQAAVRAQTHQAIASRGVEMVALQGSTVVSALDSSASAMLQADAAGLPFAVHATAATAMPPVLRPIDAHASTRIDAGRGRRLPSPLAPVSVGAGAASSPQAVAAAAGAGLQMLPFLPGNARVDIAHGPSAVMLDNMQMDVQVETHATAAAAAAAAASAPRMASRRRVRLGAPTSPASQSAAAQNMEME